MFWVVLGLLAAFLAKTQFPGERDEALVALVAVGVVGGLLGGSAMHMAVRQGIMGAAVWSYITAFGGAVLLLALLRASGIAASKVPAAKAAPSRGTPPRRR